MSTLSNAITTTSATWLRLAEYGDWPHPRGLQRLSPDAAQHMVRYFKSLRGRLARKFGGLPVYIGHPDDAHFSGTSGHTDTRAYAWVKDLDARRDGLYGAFKWSTAGEELLANAFYKFLSPRWAMEPLGKDAFQPVRLLSVGLTNQPNIPGEAIANSTASADTGDTSVTGTTLALQEHDATYAAHTHDDAVATDADDAQAISYGQLRHALGISTEVDPLEAIGELREQSERFYRIACEQSDQLSRESTSLANARREQAGLVVQNALLSGRIAPHEAPQWQRRLEDDWDSTQPLLGARDVQLKTTAVANTRSGNGSAATGANDFIARVEAHAKAHEMNFAQAWSDLKRRQPELFQHFFATGN